MRPLVPTLSDPAARFAPLARRMGPTGMMAFGLGLAAVAVPVWLPASIGGQRTLWLTLAAGAAAGSFAASTDAIRSWRHRRWLPLAAVAIAAIATFFAAPLSDALLVAFGTGSVATLARAIVLGTVCVGPLAAAITQLLASPSTEVRFVGIGLIGGALGATAAIPIAGPLVLLPLCIVVLALTLTFSAMARVTNVPTPTRIRWEAAPIAAAAGVLLAAALQLVLLWTPPSVLSIATLAVAALSAGTLATRVSRQSAIPLLAFAAAALLLEPLAIRAALVSTATIATPLWLGSLRLLAGVALLATPLLAVARVRQSGSATTAAFAAFAASMLVPVGIGTLLLIGGAIVAATLAAQAVAAIASSPTRAEGRRAAGVRFAMLAIFGIAAVFGDVSATRPAAVLYSGDAFAAARRGVPLADILAAVPPRATATHTLPSGSMSLWSVDGLRTVVRDNGLPSGAITVDPTLAPADASTTFAVAVSLAAHPQPERVAIVGLSSGESLLAAVPSPVQSIAVVERSERVVALQPLLGNRGGLADDDRIRFVDAAPSELAAVAPLDADVILLTGSHAATLPAAGRFNRAYYERVARHASPDALIAQRLHTADLSSASFGRLVATLAGVFGEVAAIQSGGGEVLLLAGTLDGFELDAVAKRLKRPQSRAALADAGLDWATVLEARLLDTGTCRRIADRYDAFTIADAAAERTLIFELMDWQPKWKGHLATWESHGVPMIEQLDDIIIRREAISRVEDVRKRDEILEKSPDQYWAYRAAVKDRLQNRPRSAVQQVSGELAHGLYPEDQRRKDYLVALGNATADPSSDAVFTLDEYVRPFDPLLSHFVHGEAARLHERAGRPGQALSHLTTQIAYAGTDPSVRPVLDAAALLLDDPTLIDNPAVRYDFAQGLLNQLHRRWLLRSARDIGSQLEGIDLDDSVRLTRSMLDAVDAWADEADATEHWQPRKKLLRRELLDGLRRLQNRKVEQAASVARLRSKLAAQQAADDAADAVDENGFPVIEAAGNAPAASK